MRRKRVLIKGLKLLRNEGATRRDEWNRPNKKAQARLARRQKSYDKLLAKGKLDAGYKRPGSLKK